jgi:hypothetical protein
MVLQTFKMRKVQKSIIWELKSVLHLNDNCVRQILYANGQYINVLKHFIHV